MTTAFYIIGSCLAYVIVGRLVLWFMGLLDKDAANDDALAIMCIFFWWAFLLMLIVVGLIWIVHPRVAKSFWDDPPPRTMMPPPPPPPPPYENVQRAEAAEARVAELEKALREAEEWCVHSLSLQANEADRRNLENSLININTALGKNDDYV